MCLKSVIALPMTLLAVGGRPKYADIPLVQDIMTAFARDIGIGKNRLKHMSKDEAPKALAANPILGPSGTRDDVTLESVRLVLAASMSHEASGENLVDLVSKGTLGRAWARTGG